MKILKVIHGYPPTFNAGSEVYSRSICEAFLGAHEVMVFTREKDEYRLDFDVRQDVQRGVPLTIINMPREKDGYNHPQVNEIFTRLLKDWQPDIVHIGHLNHLSTGIVKVCHQMAVPSVFTLHDFWLMCPRGQFLQRNFDGKNIYQICAKQENGKCATTCYNMYHSCSPEDVEEDANYWTSWIARRMAITREVLELTDAFIAPSRYLMQRFVEDFALRKNKVEYLDYGFPTHYLKPRKKVVNRSFTFGYIGTHIPAKGVNLLIEAFGKVTGKARLKIWGRTNGESTTSLHRLVANVENPIDFEGEYMNENIAEKVFAEVDAIVVPSIWGENSPLVIHEAQACHVPVITANFGGMREYVRDGVNGLLFEHRNVKSLAQKLQDACDNPQKMAQMGARGYLYHSEGKVPSVSEHCEALISIYQKIIIKHAATRTMASHY